MSSSRINIAVLGVKGLPFTGGIETIMEEIGQRLVLSGYRFDVFVRKSYMTGKRDLKIYKGINLKYSLGIHSKHLDAITHSFTAMIKILFGGYNIVYINTIGLSVLGFIPKLFGRKVIVQVHGLDFKREKWNLFAKLFLRFSCYTTVWFSDQIICVSLQDKSYFKARFRADCVYIQNGVTQKKIINPDLIKKKYGFKKNGYILFMARLVKEKGCHLLIEAYNHLKTDKILVIAGDNSHMEAYSENLKKQANNCIHFLGFIDGQVKEELLSNTYCYILPSTLEAMPISLLEAMSFGNCIVASDLPELKDILQDEGILFKVGSVQDLREKLSFALDNPAFVKAQSKKMIELIRRNHNWDRIFYQYRDYINI